MFSDTPIFRLTQMIFFRMDIILLYLNSTVRPHLIMRPCNATLSSIFLRFSFHRVLLSFWQNSRSSLYLLLIASTCFLRILLYSRHFMLHDFIKEMLQGRHSKSITLLQAFHSNIFCVADPLKMVEITCLALASPMNAEPPMGSGVGKCLWANCLFLLSLYSRFFSLFHKRKHSFS